MVRRLLPIALCLSLAGCFNLNSLTSDQSNSNSTFISGTNVTLGPTTTIALEKIVYWSGVGAIAYFVTDPFAPNWEIEEAQFPNDHYLLSLKMKRYYVGGAGEAKMVFNHRAKELANAGGFSGYKIVEYNEGMLSNVIGSQRIAQGVVMLTGAVQSPRSSR